MIYINLYSFCIFILSNLEVLIRLMMIGCFYHLEDIEWRKDSSNKVSWLKVYYSESATLRKYLYVYFSISTYWSTFNVSYYMNRKKRSEFNRLEICFRGNRFILNRRNNYSFFINYRFLVNRHSKRLRIIFRRQVQLVRHLVL